MSEFVLWVLLVPLSAISAWFMTRVLDRLTGVKFSVDIYPSIRDGNLAAGVYFGLRFLGACLLAAYMFSRWIPTVL